MIIYTFSGCVSQNWYKYKRAMVFFFPNLIWTHWWRVYFLLILFKRAHQYAHPPFDLHGVGCRPPLLFQTPLCLLATREQRLPNVRGLDTVKPTIQLHTWPQKHTIFTSYDFCFCFLFRRIKNKKSSWCSGITLVFVLTGILQHVEEFRNQHLEFREGKNTTIKVTIKWFAENTWCLLKDLNK